jgi:hypothetical protein
MLKQRGYFLLKRESGDVGLNFRTWTFQRFCEKSGDISFQQMIELLSGGIGIKQMADLLLCAAEYQYVKEQKPFPFTNFDACEWIDELGGINGAAFMEVITAASNALVDQGAKADDKKKEVSQ